MGNSQDEYLPRRVRRIEILEAWALREHLLGYDSAEIDRVIVALVAKMTPDEALVHRQFVRDRTECVKAAVAALEARRAQRERETTNRASWVRRGYDMCRRALRVMWHGRG